MTFVVRTFAFLLVISNMILVNSQLIGQYGQDCSFGIDDTPFATPNGCDVAGQIISDNGGKIECVENFDCCLCGIMICGDPGGTPCDEFNCNGDSACFGVQDIQIYGSASTGAVISCNGDQSCNGTKITGSNIAEIGCTGDGACARSSFEFNCMHDEPCVISCVGDGACAGDPNYNNGDSGEDDDVLTTTFTIDNTAGIECSADACKYGTFNLRNNIGGGMISCDGYSSCLKSEITINNIEGIICGATESCKDATFLIIDPQQDFSVECSAVDSCSGLSLEVVINNDVDFFKEIHCGGRGCIGAQFMIYNFGAKFINVETLGCEAPSACTNAEFDFDGGIAFEECKCGEEASHACDGISGIDSCLSGLEKLECSGTDSCHSLQQALSNIANDFELICSDATSCKGFWLMIVLNNNARDPVHSIKGYKCDSDEACLDAIIQLNNEQDNVSVEIEKIDCGGVSSCHNALFITSGDVVINEIACGDDSCHNCMVQNASINTRIPCTSFK